jgi:hypothetical protein
MPRPAAGDTLTSRRGNLAMRRCTKSASPATSLQKIATTFSLTTHLRPELNDDRRRRRRHGNRVGDLTSVIAHRVDSLRCEGSDAIGAKRTCRERRERVDLTKMTLNRHKREDFAAMHRRAYGPMMC